MKKWRDIPGGCLALAVGFNADSFVNSRFVISLSLSSSFLSFFLSFSSATFPLMFILAGVEYRPASSLR